MSGQQYADLIQQQALRAGIDPRWALATAQTESSLNPNAVSPAGAQGLMQLMPQTARALQVNPFVPAQNVRGGVDLLAQNLRRYGSPEEASAAYFGGTNPANWGSKTRAYVQKVAANYAKDQAVMSAPQQTNGTSDPSAVISGFFSKIGQAKSASMSPPDTAAQPNSAGVITGFFNKIGANKPAPERDNIGQDFVSGLVKGVQGIGSLAASPAMQALLRAVGPKPVAIPETVRKVEAMADSTHPHSLMGKAVQGAGNFVSYLPLMPEASLMGLAKQAIELGTAGGVSAIGKKYAGPVGELVGALAPEAAASGIGKGVEMLAGPSLSPEKVSLARNYQALGGKLGGTELSQSPILHYLNSTAKSVPLMGNAAHDEAVQQGFNRAVANQMGAVATKITPRVMSATKERLGNTFNALADQIPIHADDQLLTDLGSIQSAADAELPESTTKPINKQIDDILSAVGTDDIITGKQYQALTRKGTPLARAMNATDPNIRFFAGQVRNALDAAMERSAPPELRSALQKARYQYKVMKTIEPLVEKSPAGDISPTLLMQKVSKSFGNMAYDGGGPMGTIAKAGQGFLKEPPNSGTAQRAAALSLLTGGLGGGVALGMLDPGAVVANMPSAGGALMGAAAMRGLLSGARSDAAANYLLRRAERPSRAPTPSMQLLKQSRQ